MEALKSSTSHSTELISIEEIPPPYQNIFAEYPTFNNIQSTVFHDIIYSDRSIALTAPTGCGKTAIFELAIVKHLLSLENNYHNFFKIVYIAPVKALCEERLVDWHRKFSPFGLNCISITGDSDYIDFDKLTNHNIFITTPEKWDALTRKWKDNIKTIQLIKLVLIDEIHLLNDDSRGATMEALICRMKAIESSIKDLGNLDNKPLNYSRSIRFLGVSATFPNIDDVAEWFGGPEKAVAYNFPATQRPVKLNTHIFGYPCAIKNSPFKFDISLNYKLPSLIMNHSNGKPTLIFCSTRKMVEMTANYLKQALAIPLKPDQKARIYEVASKLADPKIKNLITNGIGYHHGGLMPEERHEIENLFRESGLPVLITTSTLAMGVNLPAHLVIIKSTKCYDKGSFKDYTATALMQMLGRAGRPQFDSEATAIIMTQAAEKEKFAKLINGSEPVESKLHKNLTEHLNAEIVLQTITHLDMAMHWLSSTFLYIRARKNPRRYNIPIGLSEEQINKKLLEVCQIDLNRLIKDKMVEMDEDANIRPTFIGNLMAKYYLSYETVKHFKHLNGKECLQQMLSFISSCHEFSEMHLRVNEKKCLNLLNNSKNLNTIRFPLKGKIKTLEMKINCIIQAVFGCLEFYDHSLVSETYKVMRQGERICKCLIEYLEVRSDCYMTVLSTILLGKCFKSQIWENSPYVSKQLPAIGIVTAKLLVNAGIKTFDGIINNNPRNIEMIIKKKPPTGNKLIEMAASIPRYNVQLKKLTNDDEVHLEITINLTNSENLHTPTVTLNSIMCLLVGDNLNNILLFERYMHSYMLDNPRVVKKVRMNMKNSGFEEIYVNFISEDFVGMDCTLKYFVRDHSLKCQDEVNEKSLKKISVQKDDKKCAGKFKKLDTNYHNLIQTYVDQYLKMEKDDQVKVTSNQKKNYLNNSTVNKVDEEKELKTVKNTNDLNNNKIIVHQNIVLKKPNDTETNNKVQNWMNWKSETSFSIFDVSQLEKDFNDSRNDIVEKSCNEEKDLNLDDLVSTQTLELLNFKFDKDQSLENKQKVFDLPMSRHLENIVKKYDFDQKILNMSRRQKPKNCNKLRSNNTKKSKAGSIKKLHSTKSFERTLLQNINTEKPKTEFSEFRYQIKKLNHTDSNKTLFSPSTRKRKLSDNFDMYINKENNPKSVTWRSPLIFPSKFSPTITSNNDSGDMENSCVSDKSISPMKKIPKLLSNNENQRYSMPFKTQRVPTKFPLSDEAYELNKSKNESFSSVTSADNLTQNGVKSKDNFNDLLNISRGKYYSDGNKSANWQSLKKPFFLNEKSDNSANNFHRLENSSKINNFQDKKMYPTFSNQQTGYNPMNFIQNSNNFQNIANTFINNQPKRYENYEALPINNFNFGKNHPAYLNDVYGRINNPSLNGVPYHYQNYYENPHVMCGPNPSKCYNYPPGYFLNNPNHLMPQKRLISRDEILRQHLISQRLDTSKSINKHFETTKPNFNPNLMNPNECTEFRNIGLNNRMQNQDIEDLTCTYKNLNPYYGGISHGYNFCPGPNFNDVQPRDANISLNFARSNSFPQSLNVSTYGQSVPRISDQNYDVNLKSTRNNFALSPRNNYLD